MNRFSKILSLCLALNYAVLGVIGPSRVLSCFEQKRIKPPAYEMRKVTGQGVCAIRRHLRESRPRYSDALSLLYPIPRALGSERVSLTGTVGPPAAVALSLPRPRDPPAA